jgi:trans-L-3-hydroxyproline dehydratase
MARIELSYTDMHTAGEPVRIVTGGYPALTGATILDKRRQAREQYDHLRRAMMFEPRGHEGMYGVIPVKPSVPGAVLGVLFTHHEGYSTMCGHATVALGRWIVDQGLVTKTEPVTRFIMEAPCGPLAMECHVVNGAVTSVTFESVPAFVEGHDETFDVPGYGSITTDIAYGGAYYAILPASRFGLDLFATPVAQLVDAAAALTDTIRAQRKIAHPDADDLGFLYGTIVTDEAVGDTPSANLCVFAERQIDRAPTGSGVTARMALDHAKGHIALGAMRRFYGIAGVPFDGRITRVDGPAVRVAVSGQGYYAGQGSFIIEDDDALGYGFELPKYFNRV